MVARKGLKRIALVLLSTDGYNFIYRWQWRIRHHLKLILDPTYPRRDMENHIQTYYPGLQFNSNSVVLDLGAHEGWFSDLCARAGAKVVAFEPNPYTFKKGFKRLHSRKHVMYINAAVSTYSGWSSMYFPRDYKFAPELHSGSGSLMRDNNSLDLSNEVSCAVLSLQSILDQFDSIDFVKVDVEGAERYLWPIFARNHYKIQHLAIETHERLFQDHEEWVTEALNFIDMNQLNGKWRLDWP